MYLIRDEVPKVIEKNSNEIAADFLYNKTTGTGVNACDDVITIFIYIKHKVLNWNYASKNAISLMILRRRKRVDKSGSLDVVKRNNRYLIYFLKSENTS